MATKSGLCVEPSNYIERATVLRIIWRNVALKAMKRFLDDQARPTYSNLEALLIDKNNMDPLKTKNSKLYDRNQLRKPLKDWDHQDLCNAVRHCTYFCNVFNGKKNYNLSNMQVTFWNANESQRLEIFEKERSTVGNQPSTDMKYMACVLIKDIRNEVLAHTSEFSTSPRQYDEVVERILSLMKLLDFDEEKINDELRNAVGRMPHKQVFLETEWVISKYFRI